MISFRILKSKVVHKIQAYRDVLAGLIWQVMFDTTANMMYTPSIAYGDGMFIAYAPPTAGGANILKSINGGSSWSLLTSDINVRFYGRMTFVPANPDNGITARFILVNLSIPGTDACAISEDGISWHYGSTPAESGWRASAASTDGLTCVAVASIAAGGTSGFLAMYSQDGGESWTVTETPLDAQWQVVFYGAGLFVAVSRDGETMHSADGITWELGETIPTINSKNFADGVYAKGLWVVINISQSEVFVSTDGISNWTRKTFLSAEGLGAANQIRYGNGSFIITSTNSTNYAISLDAITWTILPYNEPPPPGGGGRVTLTYGDGHFASITSRRRISRTV